MFYAREKKITTFDVGKTSTDPSETFIQPKPFRHRASASGGNTSDGSSMCRVKVLPKAPSKPGVKQKCSSQERSVAIDAANAGTMMRLRNRSELHGCLQKQAGSPPGGSTLALRRSPGSTSSAYCPRRGNCLPSSVTATPLIQSEWPVLYEARAANRFP